MIRLDDTTGNAVAAAIAAERHQMGSPTTGMVLTLLILADESTQADATRAAMVAAREHPMRILTLIPRPGREPHRLDAEVAVGGDDGPGELAVLRLRGELAEHAGSVCIPLLLLSGIVIWRPWFAPYFPIGLLRVAVLVHALVAWIMILAIIVHVYAAIWVKGTVRAMTRGTVSAAWAKHHHRAWYREMTGK